MAKRRLTTQAVEGLIKQALGFDESRGDTIQVTDAKLTTAVMPPALAEQPAEKEKEWWRNPDFFIMVCNISLAVAVVLLVLVMLLIAFLLLRRTAPPTPPAPQVAPAREQERIAEHLVLAAQRDPEALARAIAVLMEQP